MATSGSTRAQRDWLQASRPTTTTRGSPPIAGTPPAHCPIPDDKRLRRLQPTAVDAQTAPRDKCLCRKRSWPCRQEKVRTRLAARLAANHDRAVVTSEPRLVTHTLLHSP